MIRWWVGAEISDQFVRDLGFVSSDQRECDLPLRV